MVLWNIFRKSPVDEIVIYQPPMFDKKYKTTVSFSASVADIEKIMWINGASSGSVDVKFVDKIVYVAFEDENDALIFKIKYL